MEYNISGDNILLSTTISIKKQLVEKLIRNGSIGLDEAFILLEDDYIPEEVENINPWTTTTTEDFDYTNTIH
jgi:hypothetical protein